MPLNSIAEAILQPFVELLLQIFCYGTAWLLVPMFTCGKVFVEPVPIRKFVKPSFGKLHRNNKKYYVMDAELGSLIGLIFWLIVITITFTSL